MDFNKENITSIVMLVVIPVFTYFGFSEATKSALVGAIVAVVLLLGQIYNEKHNSELISGSPECDIDDTTEEEC